MALLISSFLFFILGKKAKKNDSICGSDRLDGTFRLFFFSVKKLSLKSRSLASYLASPLLYTLRQNFKKMFKMFKISILFFFFFLLFLSREIYDFFGKVTKIGFFEHQFNFCRSVVHLNYIVQ